MLARNNWELKPKPLTIKISQAAINFSADKELLKCRQNNYERQVEDALITRRFSRWWGCGFESRQRAFGDGENRKETVHEPCLYGHLFISHVLVNKWSNVLIVKNLFI